MTACSQNAQNSNSLESRFDPAYNAAHALFKYCPIRSDWVRRCGACWINVIRFATLENMKAILMWMSVLYAVLGPRQRILRRTLAPHPVKFILRSSAL